VGRCGCEGISEKGGAILVLGVRCVCLSVCGTWEASRGRPRSYCGRLRMFPVMSMISITLALQLDPFKRIDA
jgi:hypothetical protein